MYDFIFLQQTSIVLNINYYKMSNKILYYCSNYDTYIDTFCSYTHNFAGLNLLKAIFFVSLYIFASLK